MHFVWRSTVILTKMVVMQLLVALCFEHVARELPPNTTWTEG